MHCYLVNLVSVMMHNSCATMQKCDGLDYMQMKASMGKEDNKHIKGLLGMVKGEGLKKHICVKPKPSNLVAKMLLRLLEEAGYISDGLIHKSKWPVNHVMDAAQQVGRGDCGMYILKYCEFLTSNVDLAKISHDPMSFFQLKLALQLL
ncbi:unnamed protein product [Prunus brigantina]